MSCDSSKCVAFLRSLVRNPSGLQFSVCLALSNSYCSHDSLTNHVIAMETVDMKNNALKEVYRG